MPVPLSSAALQHTAELGTRHLLMGAVLGCYGDCVLVWCHQEIGVQPCIGSRRCTMGTVPFCPAWTIFWLGRSKRGVLYSVPPNTVAEWELLPSQPAIQPPFGAIWPIAPKVGDLWVKGGYQDHPPQSALLSAWLDPSSPRNGSRDSGLQRCVTQRWCMTQRCPFPHLSLRAGSRASSAVSSQHLGNTGSAVP